MKLKSIIIIWALLSMGFAPAQEWSRYISNNKRERDKIETRATVSGHGQERRIQGGSVVRATWVTEAVARVKVSRIIDEERLNNEQAEKEFELLRPLNEYRFYVTLYSDSYPDPLNRNGLFLQRAQDRKAFARGKATGGNYIGGDGFWNTYFYNITIPKTAEDGQPIVRNLNDEVELSLAAPGGPVIVKYKIKDLVTRLEDL